MCPCGAPPQESMGQSTKNDEALIRDFVKTSYGITANGKYEDLIYLQELNPDDYRINFLLDASSHMQPDGCNSYL